MAENPGGEEQQGLDQGKHCVDGDPHEAERDGKQPQDWPGDEDQKGHWPTQHQQEGPEDQGKEEFHGECALGDNRDGPVVDDTVLGVKLQEECWERRMETGIAFEALPMDHKLTGSINRILLHENPQTASVARDRAGRSG